jgi:superfamily II DNA/RNA helicase
LAGLEIGRRYSKPANYQKAASFDQLKLDSRLLDALKAANMDSPTDIQVHPTHNAPFCMQRVT